MIQEKKNKRTTAFIIFAILCGSTGLLYSVEDVIILPKTGHRKPPVNFTHGAHSSVYSTKCLNCHHTGENTKCSGCHQRKDVGQIINLKTAFHQQCVDCHRKTSGPLGCTRCHKKTKQ